MAESRRPRPITALQAIVGAAGGTTCQRVGREGPTRRHTTDADADGQGAFLYLTLLDFFLRGLPNWFETHWSWWFSLWFVFSQKQRPSSCHLPLRLMTLTPAYHLSRQGEVAGWSAGFLMTLHKKAAKNSRWLQAGRETVGDITTFRHWIKWMKWIPMGNLPGWFKGVS